jgi:hypothetical protein
MSSEFSSGSARAVANMVVGFASENKALFDLEACYREIMGELHKDKIWLYRCQLKILLQILDLDPFVVLSLWDREELTRYVTPEETELGHFSQPNRGRGCEENWSDNWKKWVPLEIKFRSDPTVGIGLFGLEYLDWLKYIGKTNAQVLKEFYDFK